MYLFLTSSAPTSTTAQVNVFLYGWEQFTSTDGGFPVPPVIAQLTTNPVVIPPLSGGLPAPVRIIFFNTPGNVFRCDNTANTHFALFFTHSTPGLTLYWHAISGDFSNPHGTGSQVAALTSSDGGATFVEGSGGTPNVWGGVFMQAVKNTCSPSQTPSTSLTASLSQSMTVSPSQTQTTSPTQSSSLTGPIFFDGTAGQTLPVLTGTTNASLVNSTSWLAVSFLVNESDPTCGLGRWSLSAVSLALSRVTLSTASITVQLFTADPTTGVPLSGFAATQVVGQAIPGTPGYVVVPLSALQLDTSGSRGTHYALVISASPNITWHSVRSDTPSYLPAQGVASVYGFWASENAGVTWVPAAPYRGIELWAIKRICSPTPTQSQTLSLSLSPSQTQSQTLSQSLTSTSTQTQSRTQSSSQAPTITQSLSVSQSQTVSQSISQTQTPSQTQSWTQTLSQQPTLSGTATSSQSTTQSQARTPSRSSTGSPSVSQSASQTLTSSQTQAPSRTQTQTQTASQSPSQSPTQTSTQGPTPTQATTLSQTSSISQTPTGPCMFDGTTSLTASIAMGAGSFDTLNNTSQVAISFSVSESDSTCGPGLYSLTQVQLALSVASAASVTFQVKVFTTDVSILLVSGASIHIKLCPVICCPLPCPVLHWATAGTHRLHDSDDTRVGYCWLCHSSAGQPSV
jgi:hypothetical protein